jgi:hypothetical protein
MSQRDHNQAGEGLANDKPLLTPVAKLCRINVDIIGKKRLGQARQTEVRDAIH